MKPIVYLYFHSKILNWKGREMKTKEFMSCFFQWRIPKDLRYNIMKEMERFGLVTINKKMVYLNDVYLKKTNKKKGEELKDGDTKVENPYFNYNNL